jgi:hypothetical protein
MQTQITNPQGRDAVSSGRNSLTYRSHLLPLSSGTDSKTRNFLLASEDGGSMDLRNVG